MCEIRSQNLSDGELFYIIKKGAKNFSRETTRMKAIKAAILIVLFPVIALAHAGGHDIRGTIVKVEQETLTIKRTDGVSEAVPLVAATTYRVGDAAGQWSDLHVGSRAVVHIGRDGKAIAVHLPAPK